MRSSGSAGSLDCYSRLEQTLVRVAQPQSGRKLALSMLTGPGVGWSEQTGYVPRKGS